MTAVYARLADTTIREHWECAQKINIRGEPVDTTIRRAAHRCRMDETQPHPRENGAAQRLLRSAAAEIVPARQRVSDLPAVRHHRGIPAPATQTARRHPGVDRSRRDQRSHPPGRDEPHRRNQPARHRHHPRSPAVTTADAQLRAAKHVVGKKPPMHHDDSQHLVDPASRRRADTFERARRALCELGENGHRHTVTQIAAQASVSRSWLYAQPELRDQIRRLTVVPAISNAPTCTVNSAPPASAPPTSRTPSTTQTPSSHHQTAESTQDNVSPAQLGDLLAQRLVRSPRRSATSQRVAGPSRLPSAGSTSATPMSFESARYAWSPKCGRSTRRSGRRSPGWRAC